MTDFFDKAADDTEGDGEQHPTYKWKEDGQVVKGTMTDIKVQGTKDGRVNYLATIAEAETHEVWALWIGESPKVMRDDFIDASPAKGSLIYIAYKGNRNTKDGARSYHVHSVRAETKDFDLWQELAREKYAKEQGAGSYDGAGQAAPKQQFGPDESPF